MKLIINADDYGLTSGISDSIIELLKADAISNTTVMVCTKGVEEQCEKLKDAGFSHRAGVHLQTTQELHHKTPLSPAYEVPSLMDDSGYFPHHNHKNTFNPNKIEQEWERQIQKFITIFGHNPSHIDSHHGVHREPECTPVYLKLAQKYEISARGGKKLGQVDGTPYGVTTSTLSDSTWTGQDASLDALKDSIRTGLVKVGNGLLELVCHPGFCDAELMEVSNWNTVRENDFKVLLALAEDAWLAQEGITLVRYPSF